MTQKLLTSLISNNTIFKGKIHLYCKISHGLWLHEKDIKSGNAQELTCRICDQKLYVYKMNVNFKKEHTELCLARKEAYNGVINIERSLIKYGEDITNLLNEYANSIKFTKNILIRRKYKEQIFSELKIEDTINNPKYSKILEKIEMNASKVLQNNELKNKDKTNNYLNEEEILLLQIEKIKAKQKSSINKNITLANLKNCFAKPPEDKNQTLLEENFTPKSAILPEFEDAKVASNNLEEKSSPSLLVKKTPILRSRMRLQTMKNQYRLSTFLKELQKIKKIYLESKMTVIEECPEKLSSESKIQEDKSFLTEATTVQNSATSKPIKLIHVQATDRCDSDISHTLKETKYSREEELGKNNLLNGQIEKDILGNKIDLPSSKYSQQGRIEKPNRIIIEEGKEDTKFNLKEKAPEINNQFKIQETQNNEGSQLNYKLEKKRTHSINYS